MDEANILQDRAMLMLIAGAVFAGLALHARQLLPASVGVAICGFGGGAAAEALGIMKASDLVDVVFVTLIASVILHIAKKSMNVPMLLAGLWMIGVAVGISAQLIEPDDYQRITAFVGGA